MISPEEKLKIETKSLVEEGLKFLSCAQSLKSSMDGEELADFSAWAIRLGHLVRKVYGEKSQQFDTYSDTLKTPRFYTIHSNYNSQISVLVGVAKSIHHDIEKGLLFDFRSLVQADVFADFLEMEEYLLSEGYKDAAAVIFGSVLEDGLRKLCEKWGLSIVGANGKPLTIDPMNNALAGDGAYSKLEQKQITTWAHIRNKSAHGEYGEYTIDQVKMMLLFVQKLSSDYLK